MSSGTRGLGLELGVLALEGGVFRFQFGELFGEGGGEGSFGLEGCDFAAAFAEVIELFFRFLIAGLSFGMRFGKAFVFPVELVETGSLLTVYFSDVFLGVRDLYWGFTPIEGGRRGWLGA